MNVPTIRHSLKLFILMLIPLTMQAQTTHPIALSTLATLNKLYPTDSIQVLSKLLPSASREYLWAQVVPLKPGLYFFKQIARHTSHPMHKDTTVHTFNLLHYIRVGDTDQYRSRSISGIEDGYQALVGDTLYVPMYLTEYVLESAFVRPSEKDISIFSKPLKKDRHNAYNNIDVKSHKPYNKHFVEVQRSSTTIGHASPNAYTLKKHLTLKAIKEGQSELPPNQTSIYIHKKHQPLRLIIPNTYSLRTSGNSSSSTSNSRELQKAKDDIPLEMAVGEYVQILLSSEVIRNTTTSPIKNKRR